jgi:hypothetical protein
MNAIRINILALIVGWCAGHEVGLGIAALILLIIGVVL